MASALLCALLGAGAVIGWNATSQSGGSTLDDSLSAAGYGQEDKTAIEAIVREYILDNPEIIPEAIERLQQKQTAAKLNGIRERIETPFAAAWAGNPDGDVTLVEFADFACGYCRQSVADVDRLLAEDPNLKIVFRELPILSEASDTAAAIALGAARQGNYHDFHNAIFELGRPTDAVLARAADRAGIDLAKARAFGETDAAQAELDANLEAARTLEFTGTPSWVVGDQVFIGAVGYDRLKAAIAQARKNSGNSAGGSR